MRLAKIGVLLIGALLFSHGLGFSDTKEEFPEIGFAKDNGSNVRAGDNVNFESLYKLRKGDPVKIIDKRYSWFKIVLPKSAHLYIKNDYVDVDLDEGVGKVNAVRVNLRAGPATKYSILGQVSKPQELNVVSEKDGWYEIEPPEGTAGWVHASQISFEFIDIVRIEEEKPPVAQQPKKSANIRLMPGSPEPKGNLTFSTQAD